MAYQQLTNLESPQKNRSRPDGASSSIAIIDDLESNRSFLEHLAWREPSIRYVSSFASARDALQAFSKTPPDIVITDFHMPGMNAVDFLEAFRAVPEFEDIPVIVISSRNESKNRHRALLAGATDFLMVPFDPLEFQARTHNLLMLSLHQKNLRAQSHSLRSELQETRHRSQETRSRFTSIIDSVPAFVFALNAAGECVFANQFCYDFLDIAPADGPDALQFLAERVAAWEEGEAGADGPAPKEVLLKGTDGKNHVFLLVPSQIGDEQDGESFTVYSGIDATRLKETEISLRAAKNQAEAASRAKSAFLSNMSHELRTPLNAIMGFTDVMCSELCGPIENESYKTYLGHVQSAANQLLYAVDEIIEFSELEANRHVIHLVRFRLRECLEGVRALNAQQIEANGNRLEIAQMPDLELHCDRRKLQQVLLNLVSNANRATRKGVIRISAARRLSGELVMRINDNGVGMDANEVSLAVTEFGRAMTSPFVSEGDLGTGLGLPIAIRLMKLMGGELQIESEKGTGTTARLTLPRTAVIEQSEPAPKAEAASQPTADGSEDGGAKGD